MDIAGAQVVDSLDPARAVDQNRRVIHFSEGRLQSILSAGFRPYLYRSRAVAVEYRQIHVRVRDQVQCIIRSNDSTGRRVAPEHDLVRAHRGSDVLGTNVSLLVALELAALVFLAPVHHLIKEADRPGLVGPQILPFDIKAPQFLRELLLPCVPLVDQALCRPAPGGFPVKVHRLQLGTHKPPDPHPEYRLCSVENESGARITIDLVVDIFLAVGHRQLAGVVDAKSCVVVVIPQIETVAAVDRGFRIVDRVILGVIAHLRGFRLSNERLAVVPERVLGPVVDHGVAFCEQIPVKRGFCDEPVPELADELCVRGCDYPLIHIAPYLL